MSDMVPDYRARDVYDLTPEFFKSLGVRLLLMDLDNTLSPYGETSPSRDLKDWIAGLVEGGIEPFILSNNRGGRPKAFAEALGIGFMGRAGKPSTDTLLAVLEQKGVSKEHAALVGDTLFTDILCARRAGVTAIAVRPISMKNPLLAIRYAADLPFRGRCGRIIVKGMRAK